MQPQGLESDNQPPQRVDKQKPHGQDLLPQNEPPGPSTTTGQQPTSVGQTSSPVSNVESLPGHQTEPPQKTQHHPPLK